jgi:hypothetical protein
MQVRDGQATLASQGRVDWLLYGCAVG